MRGELSDHAAYCREGLTEKPTLLRLVADPRLERLQDLLLAARAHSREIAQPALGGGALEPAERGDAELSPDARRCLRADSGEPQEVHDARRYEAAALVSVHLAALDDLDDLVLDRLADARSSFAFPSSASSAIGSGDSRIRPAARRYAITLNDSSSRISERSASRSSWSANASLRGNV
jgi:hypothetical protein